ncbi:uncharacterized protein [Channa argus]|uniref:uncharacterized protein n=1 Tax=Channa argus TaxID=215402 RepID=UPI0035205907
MKTSSVCLILSVSVLLLLSGLTVSADHRLVLKFSEDPVMTGSDVTLQCKKTKGDFVEAYFYFNENLLQTDLNVGFTIHKVQRSHEGLYLCSTDLLGKSPESRLRVKDPPTTSAPPHTTTSSTNSNPHTITVSTSTLKSYVTSNFSQTSLFSTSLLAPVVAALGSLFILVLVVVGLKLLRKQTGRNSSSPPGDVTYADVNVRQTANKRGPTEVTYGQVVIKNHRKTGRRTEQPSDPDVTYSSVRAGI